MLDEPRLKTVSSHPKGARTGQARAFEEGEVAVREREQRSLVLIRSTSSWTFPAELINRLSEVREKWRAERDDRCKQEELLRQTDQNALSTQLRRSCAWPSRSAAQRDMQRFSKSRSMLQRSFGARRAEPQARAFSPGRNMGSRGMGSPLDSRPAASNRERMRLLLSMSTLLREAFGSP